LAKFDTTQTITSRQCITYVHLIGLRPNPYIKLSPATSSTPPTPQMGRRRLELLPRSTNASASTSPLSSPKLASAAGPRSNINPFGSARSVPANDTRRLLMNLCRPVDVSSREKDIADRLDREKEHLKDRSFHSMSRTSSRAASERNHVGTPRTPPAQLSNDLSASPPSSPKPTPAISSTVRPSLSFANVAGTRKENLPERNVA
jgi:hypothetical protein